MHHLETGVTETFSKTAHSQVHEHGLLRQQVSGRKSLEEGRPEELVGSGPGLTPAGDDFLTGAILASDASVVLDRARLERVLPGTTPHGRTLLWMALQGRFPAYLVDFIDTVTGNDVSFGAISRAVQAACAHGGMSGTDALAGFCWHKGAFLLAVLGIKYI